MKRLCLLSLVFVSGCFSDGGCSLKRLPQPVADKIAFDLMAQSFNEAQTNWTILVVPRTNQIKP